MSSGENIVSSSDFKYTQEFHARNVNGKWVIIYGEDDRVIGNLGYASHEEAVCVTGFLRVYMRPWMEKFACDARKLVESKDQRIKELEEKLALAEAKMKKIRQEADCYKEEVDSFYDTAAYYKRKIKTYYDDAEDWSITEKKYIDYYQE